MVSKRTEDEVLARALIIVILGGQEREILPLVIRDSRPWRKKIVGILATLPKNLKDNEDPDDFERAFNLMANDLPDEVIELFFEYAKDLNREEIEAVATEAELGIAFKQVIEVAFPLAQSLPDTMGHLSQ